MLALSLGLAALACSDGEVARDAATPPGGGRWNVLMIVVDDLNAWVSHLGTHPNARTPHIDRLAERGTSFSRAYSLAPSCEPARAAALTGIRPWKSGVYDGRQNWFSALEGVTSLPQHFTRNGYLTMATGKIADRPDSAAIREELRRHLLEEEAEPYRNAPAGR